MVRIYDLNYCHRNHRNTDLLQIRSSLLVREEIVKRKFVTIRISFKQEITKTKRHKYLIQIKTEEKHNVQSQKNYIKTNKTILK